MNYRKEHIIYTIMWITLYLWPVMAMYMRMSSNPDIVFSWHEIYNAWKFDTVWLVLFAIHNFLLAPLLIVRRRTWLYSALCLALLGCAMTMLYVMRPSPEERMEERMHRLCVEKRVHGWHGPDPARSPHRRAQDMRPIGPLDILGPGEMVAALGGLLFMGMNLGVKLFFKSQEDSKVLAQTERQNLERQLEYLRYQINPHFFMNTLNNIHALVDIDPERAKTTIVELSKMMRYILYEGNNRHIPLTREVQFLRNYVRLMSLRYTDRVGIRMSVPDSLPELMLPPLLLIVFVENAFKHGISYRTESFVEVSVDVGGGRLMFRCRNSKATEQQPSEAKKGGMGLVNVRRRLDLLFAKDYTLDISDGKNVYDVRLDIPLSKEC